MFRPISPLPYRLCDRNAQALLVRAEDSAPSAWDGRVAAAVTDSAVVALRDIVRDILHNPQIRVVAFDGECRCRPAFADFWSGTEVPAWGIDGEHVALVRQFVDLYDGDFVLRGPQQPFWPSRVMYLQ
jgi:hypothetical protein